jgi:hypothetical protein
MGQSYTACAFDICLYSTPLGLARQFIETCGTYSLFCGSKFVLFLGLFVISAQAANKINILTAHHKQIFNAQAVFRQEIKTLICHNNVERINLMRR